MAKDTRLDELKEGAGLEESRINQDLVDFLRRWSSPVLLVLAAISLGYFFWTKQQEARLARVDEAFQQFNQSTNAGAVSPDVLKRIAEDFDDVEGVHLLATLYAADQYLRAVRRGVTPGAELSAAGEPVNEEDMLSDEEGSRFLEEAESLYRRVFDRTQSKPAMAIHQLSALYGLAAVAESRGDLDRAKNVLDQAETLAGKQGFLEHVQITSMRKDRLASLAEPVILYDKADLPVIPALVPPEPELPELGLDDLTGPAIPDEDTGGEDPGSDDGMPIDESGGGEGPGDGQGEDSGEADPDGSR